MSSKSDLPARLAFLARIAHKEKEYLRYTAGRLLPQTGPVTSVMVSSWIDSPDTAERLDAFVARFGRLQDTLGDKLVPSLLRFLGEQTGPALDNLNKAEKFGWIPSADEWMLYRKLRNQMVHEYIEDPAILADALTAGRDFSVELCKMAEELVGEAQRRLKAIEEGGHL